MTKDRFVEIRTRANNLGKFTKAAVILELDANGMVNICWTANPMELAAMQTNLQAMVLKDVINHMPLKIELNQDGQTN